MAAAFDVGFEASFSGGPAKPVTVNGTLAAGATVLIAVMGFNGTNAQIGAVSMTWDGVAMTQIGSAVELAAGSFSIVMFGLKNPATGTRTLSGTWAGTGVQVVMIGAASFTGSDTVGTGWDGATSSTGTATPAAVTVTTSSGSIAVCGHVNANSPGLTINTGTVAWAPDTGSADGNYGQGYRADNAGSTTISWNTGGTVQWANIAVNVPAGAADILQGAMLSG